MTSTFLNENKDVEKAYAEGVSVGVGVQMAKQYGDMPANLCTPKFMAEECMKLAGSLGLDVTSSTKKPWKNWVWDACSV